MLALEMAGDTRVVPSAIMIGTQGLRIPDRWGDLAEVLSLRRRDGDPFKIMSRGEKYWPTGTPG